ncbi:MAG TPA: hypothetical protein VFZ31_12885 [Vicinamibacterales bacterium]
MFSQTIRPTDNRKLVSVVAFHCCDEGRMLTLAAAVAPALGPAIETAMVESLRERGMQPPPVGDIHESVSTGVAASVDGHRVVVGNAAFFEELGIALDGIGDWPQRFRQRGEQVLFVSIDGRTAGFLGLAATQSQSTS